MLYVVEDNRERSAFLIDLNGDTFTHLVGTGEVPQRVVILDDVARHRWVIEGEVGLVMLTKTARRMHAYLEEVILLQLLEALLYPFHAGILTKVLTHTQIFVMLFVLMM